jgi:serine/threonine-protein kinase
MYSIGSGSPAAIKAFLKGERHYRQSDWDSAKVYYEQAIGIDSTFALAHRRMGIVLGWDALEFGRGSDESAFHHLLASKLSAGLAPRESLLIAADSLFASMTSFSGDSTSWPLIGGLFSTLEDGVERYPKDPEMWNELGEARFHFGQSVGATHEETRLAFARAIELDSGYAPAYPHSLALSLMLDGPEAARRTAAQFLTVTRTGYEADAARLFSALLDKETAGSDDVQQMLDTLSADALFGAGRFLVRYPDSAEAAIRVARARMERDSSTSELRQSLAFRGHLREAHDVLSRGNWRAPTLGNFRSQGSFGDMAEFGAFPDDFVEAVLSQWLELGWVPGASSGIRWWAARQDTAALIRYTHMVDSLLGPPVQFQEDVIGLVRWHLRIGRAHLTLARGDTAGTLRQFEAIRPWPGVFSIHSLRLTRAQLLAATGRDAEAAEILEQMSQLESAPTPLDVIWTLERARVNERLGKHDIAIRDYSYVMDVWRFADDILQPFVDEARTAVERLAGEPRG